MKALILIDIQQDFLENGALPVPQANNIIPYINQIMPLYHWVIATQDWHPENHISFVENHFNKTPFSTIIINGKEQTLWASHCVANTTGAHFPPQLNTQYIHAIFKKGQNPYTDSYSCFFNTLGQPENQIYSFLKEKQITELHFVGLAGDVCVYHSVKDALKLRFQVSVLTQGIRSLDTATFKTQMKLLKIDFPNLKIVNS